MGHLEPTQHPPASVGPSRLHVLVVEPVFRKEQPLASSRAVWREGGGEGGRGRAQALSWRRQAGRQAALVVLKTCEWGWADCVGLGGGGGSRWGGRQAVLFLVCFLVAFAFSQWHLWFPQEPAECSGLPNAAKKHRKDRGKTEKAQKRQSGRSVKGAGLGKQQRTG